MNPCVSVLITWSGKLMEEVQRCACNQVKGAMHQATYETLGEIENKTFRNIQM